MGRNFHGVRLKTGLARACQVDSPIDQMRLRSKPFLPTCERHTTSLDPCSQRGRPSVVPGRPIAQPILLLGLMPRPALLAPSVSVGVFRHGCRIPRKPRHHVQYRTDRHIFLRGRASSFPDPRGGYLGPNGSGAPVYQPARPRATGSAEDLRGHADRSAHLR
jgi:hypothetical protein